MGSIIATILKWTGLSQGAMELIAIGAAALAAGGGVLAYNHHERDIGKQEVLAPIAVLAQKAQIKVTTGAAVAQSTEVKNAQTYTAALAAPAVRDLGIVCHSDAGSGEVPTTVAVTATRIGNNAVDGGTGPAFDPSGAILQRAHDADAQITYLQGRVQELEAQMNAAP
jgi:hypothetical protein